MFETDDASHVFHQNLEVKFLEFFAHLYDGYVMTEILFWMSLAFSSKPFLPSFIIEIHADAMKTPERLPASPGVP